MKRCDKVRVFAGLLLGLIVLLAQLPGKAQSSPPTRCRSSRTTSSPATIRVGSVDLSNPAGGFATGDIHFNDALGNTVPANADIVAAFLYWEMITLAAGPSELSQARSFAVRTSARIAKQLGPAKLLTKETSPCWTGGVG